MTGRYRSMLGTFAVACGLAAAVATLAAQGAPPRPVRKVGPGTDT